MFPRPVFNVRFILLLSVLLFVPRAGAYVEAPHSFGQVINLSSHIMVLRVERVDRAKRIILYRKVRDLKGKYPQEVIRHNLGATNGFHPREWQFPIQWAEPGKLAVFFNNGSASETCIGTYWYQAYNGGDWWNFSHGEPFLLRSYAGKPEKLASLVVEALAGKEVIVPCMVDGNKDDLHLRRAKIQRLRASLKLGDYNPKRDFVGWGDEDFRRLAGLPGFTHYSALARVDPEAQAISAIDFDGDGKTDLCLAGAGKVALLKNDGDSLGEASLPLQGGCRAAVWADYNGDGRPDLLLATPTGPKLLTNTKDGFRDDSHLLPQEPAYNLTAAAWIDHDGDGKPDILLGNGFHGLRLYRNLGKPTESKEPLRVGNWSYIGPFDNPGGTGGFNIAYPPEKETDLTKTYPGCRGEKAVWKAGKFTDGQVNNLTLFQPQNNVNAIVYLHRAIECAAPIEMPVSLGSDDTLTVWLNGVKIHAENVQRACVPDQVKLILKLRKGRNDLLLKICQGTGDWAFYFKPSVVIPPAVTWAFADVSDRVGLGAKGLGSTVKGDTLSVADVDADGHPDFLYGAGTGLLCLNRDGKFIEARNSGISYRPGRVGPVFGDLDGDGHLDLFVPQAGTCKLFRNDGKGHFTDVTARSGDLARPLGHATCAAWGDFDNDGRPDLVVGCLRGPNRFFRNRGDGTFEDASAAVGLNQRVCNTQAVCLVDLNNDGILDMVFNNEGQESCVLLGNPEWGARQTPVTFQLRGPGTLGSRVRVLDRTGKLVGSHEVSGGDARGGQSAPQARFALKPGPYRVEVVFATGDRRERKITVGGTPVRSVVESGKN
jgi:FG-GAP-like repeat